MKKILIVGALALSVAVSMVSGTMATYTKTTVPVNGQVTAKQFNIETLTETNVTASLAPGETEKWEFSVVNYAGNDESTVTEVDMDLYLDLHVGNTDYIGEGRDVLEGLQVSLYEKGKKDEKILLNVDSQGRDYDTIANAFKGDVAEKKDYVIEMTWAGGDTESHLKDANNGAKTPIHLTINGTQSGRSWTE